MTFLTMFLMLLGPFLVVGAIAAVAQACGGPVFFPVRMPRPQFAPAYRRAVAW
jgi:hypothetical protein